MKKVSQNATDSSINVVEEDSENQTEITALPRYQSQSRKRKPAEKDDFKENILKILKTPESRHFHFFKGILPSLQALNDNQTLIFQSRVLQIQTYQQYTPLFSLQISNIHLTAILKIINIRAIIKDIQLRDTIILFRVATTLLLLDVPVVKYWSASSSQIHSEPSNHQRSINSPFTMEETTSTSYGTQDEEFDFSRTLYF